MKKKVSETTIEAAQNGDRKAICLLLDEVQPELLRYAGRVCHSSEDARDAVQETMVIISQKIDGLRILSAFFGWAFQIIIRECMRLKEKAQKLLTNQDEIDDNTLIANRTDETLKVELALALEKLSSDHRTAILLHYFLGFTAIEISEKLNISLEAAKSRLRRAKKALSEILA